MNKKYNYKEESRKDWTVEKGTLDGVSKEDLTLGAILRIADATELMAKNFLQLQKENNHLRESNNWLMHYYEKEKKKASTYKGLYHKEKNKNNNQNL